MDVYLEVGSKKVFASAAEWPGWSRSGKTEEAALEMLADYASRYAVVASAAGLRLPAKAAEHLEVIERVAGSATTDFGAPGSVPDIDRRPLKGKDERPRVANLLSAAWGVLDGVVDRAPARLRKGPRGGGRDRDAIVEHVLGAEVAYARKVGVRLTQPDPADRAAVEGEREAILAAVASGTDDKWPARYLARRTAWHALDHAWEIEDRAEPGPSVTP